MKLAHSFAALALVSVTAHAQSGGFSGPDNRRAVTTAEIAALDDDTSVRLVGYVVEAVGDEEYTFRDETGTIIVEIDGDEWNGLEVTPTMRVEIAGEVDRDGGKAEIEVDSIRLAD